MLRSIKIGEKITDKVEVTPMFGKTLSPIFIILTSVSNHIIFSSNFYLNDKTSTFFSLLMTEMSDNSAPQQLSFLTWFMSLTLVLATIMSSLSFTMMFVNNNQIWDDTKLYINFSESVTLHWFCFLFYLEQTS